MDRKIAEEVFQIQIQTQLLLYRKMEIATMFGNRPWEDIATLAMKFFMENGVTNEQS